MERVYSYNHGVKDPARGSCWQIFQLRFKRYDHVLSSKNNFDYSGRGQP